MIDITLLYDSDNSSYKSTCMCEALNKTCLHYKLSNNYLKIEIWYLDSETFIFRLHVLCICCSAYNIKYIYRSVEVNIQWEHLVHV